MMLARLRGTVEDAGLDTVLIDAGGLGFPVQVSTRTKASLPAQGEPVTLLIETHLREDAIFYFGFVDRAERDWFRLLTMVQGVGGKVALNLLSALEPDRLAHAILAEDKAMLTRADGVGPKLAARLVTELKDKAAAWRIGLPALEPATRAGVAKPAAMPASRRTDAIAALIGLQFRPLDAEVAVAAAERKLGDAAATEALIRAALAEFAR